MSEIPFSPEPLEPPERWRVLQVATQSLTAARFVAPYARYLRRRGHEVTLACSPRSFPDAPCHVPQLRQEGFEVIEVDFARAIEPARDLSALLELLALLSTRRFDVVHTHNSKAGVLGRVAASLARVPGVFHTNHGLAVDVNGRYSWLQERLHAAVERQVSRLTDMIFVVSEAERAKALEWGIAPAARMVLVGQGVDTSFFSPGRVTDGDVVAWRRDLGLPEGPIVATVARLVDEKGVDVALEAAAELSLSHPRATLVLAGDGPLRGALEARRDALGLRGRVAFLGHLDPSGVRHLMAAAEVFVLPTRWESFGVVLLEAMAMQLPVVTSDIAPVNGLVRDGVDGLLAPLEDASAFAGAVAALLEAPERRRAMGQAGRRRACAHFDDQAFFRRIESGYRAILSDDGPDSAEARSTR